MHQTPRLVDAAQPVDKKVNNGNDTLVDAFN
jgi:hypothetical protein